MNNFNNRYPRKYNSNGHGRYNNHQQGFMPAWRPVERKTKGTIAVEVTEQPLNVPKFSITTGSARLDPNGQVLETIPYINVMAIPDLVEVLLEIHAQYSQKRAEAARALEAQRAHYNSDEVDYEADLEDRGGRGREGYEEPLAAPRRR